MADEPILQGSYAGFIHMRTLGGKSNIAMPSGWGDDTACSRAGGIKMRIIADIEVREIKNS